MSNSVIILNFNQQKPVINGFLTVTGVINSF